MCGLFWSHVPSQSAWSPNLAMRIWIAHPLERKQRETSVSYRPLQASLLSSKPCLYLTSSVLLFISNLFLSFVCSMFHLIPDFFTCSCQCLLMHVIQDRFFLTFVLVGIDFIHRVQPYFCDVLQDHWSNIDKFKTSHHNFLHSFQKTG